MVFPLISELARGRIGDTIDGLGDELDKKSIWLVLASPISSELRSANFDDVTGCCEGGLTKRCL